jgi:hypothetical protein
MSFGNWVADDTDLDLTFADMNRMERAGTTSENAAHNDRERRDRSAGPATINGQSHIPHSDCKETPGHKDIEVKPKPSNSLIGRQLELRGISKSLKSLESQLSFLADKEYQRGREDQQQETKKEIAESQRALLQAQKDRDAALMELSSLRQDIEQLREAAKAMAVFGNFFADTKPKSPQPGIEGTRSLAETLNTHSPSVPRQPDERSITVSTKPQPTNEHSSTRSGEKTLLEILAEFSHPVIIHSKKHLFPESFIDTVLCEPDENAETPEYPWTISSISKDKRLKIVPWKTIIKIDPETHESAPDFRKHGALTFVHGDPCLDVEWQAERARPESIAQIDSVPVFRYAKKIPASASGYYYIGHCRMGARIDISAATWNRWDAFRKRRIAKGILESEWGHDMLISKGITLKTTSYPFNSALMNESIDELLSYFYREEGPRLHMVHMVLEKKKYSEKQSKDLALEFGFAEEKEDKKKRMASDESEEWVVEKRQKVVRDAWDDDFDSDYDATPK